MESLGLVNMMSFGNSKQRLDENKGKWDRYREKLRKLPLDVFNFLSHLLWMMKKEDSIGCSRNGRLGRTTARKVLRQSRDQN